LRRLTVITLTPSSPEMLRSDRLSSTRRRRIPASFAGSLELGKVEVTQASQLLKRHALQDHLVPIRAFDQEGAIV
jgi:hypothetical protein